MPPAGIPSPRPLVPFSPVPLPKVPSAGSAALQQAVAGSSVSVTSNTSSRRSSGLDVDAPVFHSQSCAASSSSTSLAPAVGASCRDTSGSVDIEGEIDDDDNDDSDSDGSQGSRPFFL